MKQEIERKFLVRSSYKQFATSFFNVRQGFLSTDPERMLRIRVTNTQGYITIKGISNASGTSRLEWEKEIPKVEAEQLLLLCGDMIVEKTRYIIPNGNSVFFEVDEFHGLNAGLIVAEIELEDEFESFSRPDWLGEEVTGKIAYYNLMLAKKPFTKW